MNTPVSVSARSSWLDLLRPGWMALRLYWKAFVLLQTLALGFLAAYDYLPEVRDFCRHLAGLKISGGLLFAAVANMVSGVAVPELLKLKLRPAGLARPTPGDLLHLCALFAVLGMMVDSFYQVQSHFFGNARTWPVLAAKIAVDQFIYTPFLALPVCIFGFQLKNDGYAVGKALKRWNLRYYLRHMLPIFIPNCLFWGPMLVAVYSMPPDLQFPLFIFAGSAWNLLLVFMAKRETET